MSDWTLTEDDGIAVLTFARPPRNFMSFAALSPSSANGCASLARDGGSNREIADQLVVNRKTIEYHLHKVFIKLGISTREHLDRVLPAD